MHGSPLNMEFMFSAQPVQLSAEALGRRGIAGQAGTGADGSIVDRWVGCLHQHVSQIIPQFGTQRHQKQAPRVS